MLPTTTVSDLAAHGELHFLKGVYNIIDCGVRTGKTYWATHNLQQYTRDSRLDRILFLVNTTMLKNQILNEYSDYCCDADSIWETKSEKWGEIVNKIGVMCYQGLSSRIVKGDVEFLAHLDVICWDECDSIFDFAVDAFAKARRTDFGRKNMSNAEVLTAIQQYSTKSDYFSLVLLGAWEQIVQAGEILCIGLSASPERARNYYATFTNASYNGQCDAHFRAKETIYFTNILDHIRTLSPQPDHGYWCYSPSIRVNKGIVTAAINAGFNAIELHSPNNTDYPMDEEQMRVYKILEATHLVVAPYDFVIINATGKTGISIDDQRFDKILINSLRRDERIQAPRQTFPYQVHQKVWMGEIPAEYLNTWLTVKQCRELAGLLAVTDLVSANSRHHSNILTWNSLKDYLPAFGYSVEQRRKQIEGKQQTCYYISGEWCDVVPPDQAFDTLVAAHQELQLTAVSGAE